MISKSRFRATDLRRYVDNSAYNDITFEKPLTRPHCGVVVEAERVSANSHLYETDGRGECFIFVWRCTCCRKLFVSMYLLQNKQMSLLGILPNNAVVYTDEEIEKISPRFIEMYSQALRAEDNGDYNLAAIGFRSAIEILIKDYAITCLGQSRGEVVNMSLYNAISSYLGENDLIKTADVVRILGNDHTHYERKYPEHDFALLKNYVDIAISLIRQKILIKSPPVSR